MIRKSRNYGCIYLTQSTAKNIWSMNGSNYPQEGYHLGREVRQIRKSLQYVMCLENTKKAQGTVSKMAPPQKKWQADWNTKDM